MPRIKRVPKQEVFIKQEPELQISDTIVGREVNFSDVIEIPQKIKEEPNDVYEILFLDNKEDEFENGEYDRYIGADFIEPEVILANGTDSSGGSTEEEYDVKILQARVEKASKDLARYMKGLQSDLDEPEVGSEPVKLKTFICDYCGETFKSSMARYRHSKTHTDNHRCPHCRKIFTKKSQFVNHLKTHERKPKQTKKRATKLHLPKVPLKCNGCNKVLVNKICHYRCPKKESKGFQCGVCLGWFKTKLSLRFHQQDEHQPVAFPCPICTQNFETEQMRKIHHQEVHLSRTGGGQQPFACGQCGKRYKSKYAWREHVAKVHENIALYDCKLCGERFFTTYARNLHRIARHPDKLLEPSPEVNRAWNGTPNADWKKGAMKTAARKKL